MRRNSPPSALEALFERHAADVYRYALGMVPRQADAEDVVQSTFLNAYRALERGERPRNPGAWLRKIALNVCREQYRRTSRRPEEVSLEHDPGELVSEPDGPEMADVLRALGELPFNQRAALVMREFDGRSLSEIAATLEISASAAEALLFRARRSLREQLEGTLTCDQAEGALSRQLDGVLPRSERGPLRAHLRACSDCASLARRMRAQRSAVRALAGVPLPVGLRLGLFGSSSAPVAAAGVSGGSGAIASIAGWGAAKAALTALTGAAIVGVGYTAVSHHWFRHRPPVRIAAAVHVRESGAAPSPTTHATSTTPPATTPSRPLRATGSRGHGRRSSTELRHTATRGTRRAATSPSGTAPPTRASTHTVASGVTPQPSGRAVGRHRSAANAPGHSGAVSHGRRAALHGTGAGRAGHGVASTRRAGHRGSGAGRAGSPPGQQRKSQTHRAGHGHSAGGATGGRATAPGQAKKASGG